MWKTAKPYLERWMSEQIGWRGLLKALRQEAPYWATTLPQLPRLLQRALAEDRLGAMHATLEKLARENARRNKLISALLLALVAFAAVVALALF